MARDDSAPAKMPPPSIWRWLPPILLALAIGGLGGFVFERLTLPLPWMLGAMAFVTIGAVGGLKLRMPRQPRAVMITVLGVMLGSAFTPEVIARMGEWVITVSALAIWSILAGGLGLLYFRRVAKYDPVTAYFSSTPGGLNEMVVVGGLLGGDERVISLTHASRVMLVVFTIPIWYRLTHDIAPAAQAARVGLLDVAPIDVAALTLCAVVGALGFERLRVPAAYLVGPMILSAAVHLAGVTDSKPPYAIVSAAQVVIGATLGCRFVGVSLAMIGHAVRHSIVAAIAMLAMTILFAWALSHITGYPLPALILAFAPGGLAEMSLVALALDVDAAFVASHHIARIVMVVILAPVAFRLMRRAGQGDGR